MYRYAISIEISNETANNSGVSILFTHPLNVLLRFVWKNQAIANQGVVMSILQEQARHKPAYDRVARFLHWLVMVLIAVQFVIGWTMPGVDGNTRPLGLIAWHLAVGTTLILAMAVRIVWRFTHKPPPHALPPVLSAVSRATHFLLYAFLIAVPLLGWANASSRGWAVGLFGVFHLPALTPTGSSFGNAMGDIHGDLAWVLFALIGMHVAAALFHRFVLKDRVLQRMMP
jgi:cytochrome b561